MTHHTDSQVVLTDTQHGASAPTTSPAHVAGAHATPGIMDRLRQPYTAPECPAFWSFRRLCPDNGLAWKTRMRVVLRCYDALEIVVDVIPKPDDPASAAGWTSRDEIAQYLIVMNLRDEDLVTIYDCNTAAGMWSRLDFDFESLGQWSLQNTRRRRGKKKMAFGGGA